MKLPKNSQMVDIIEYLEPQYAEVADEFDFLLTRCQEVGANKMYAALTVIGMAMTLGEDAMTLLAQNNTMIALKFVAACMDIWDDFEE